MLRCASPFVIAAYVYVRLIPQGSRALPAAFLRSRPNFKAFVTFNESVKPDGQITPQFAGGMPRRRGPLKKRLAVVEFFVDPDVFGNHVSQAVEFAGLPHDPPDLFFPDFVGAAVEGRAFFKSVPTAAGVVVGG